MLSGAATDAALQRSSELEFVGALALFFKKRDLALDITWDSKRVRGLLWYYNRLHLLHIEKSLTVDQMTAAFNAGMARGARARMAEIMAEAQAEETTTERRRELLDEASRIHDKLQQAIEPG